MSDKTGKEKPSQPLQLSVDGLIEGPNGGMDRATKKYDAMWQEMFALVKNVDTVGLVRKMGSQVS